MTCDPCNGTGQLECMVHNRPREDAEAVLQLRAMACSRCDGTGEVPDDALKREAHGRVLRGQRLRRGHNLKEAAELARLRADSGVVTFSRAERGMSDVGTITTIFQEYTLASPLEEEAADV